MESRAVPRAPAGPDGPGAAVFVWLAPAACTESEEILGACRALLPRGETDECDAFRRDADRRLAALSRAFVRTTLSRHAAVDEAEVDPRAWEIARADRVRPEVSAPSGTRLRFSVSHTRDVVACAVTTDAPIGVDVETAAGGADCLDLAATAFTPAEIARLRACPPSERETQFLRIWTLKEAWLKAVGLGLSLDPRSVDVELGAGGTIDARVPPGVGSAAAPWWMAVLEVPGATPLALARGGPAAPSQVVVVRVDHPWDTPRPVDARCSFVSNGLARAPAIPHALPGSAQLNGPDRPGR